MKLRNAVIVAAIIAVLCAQANAATPLRFASFQRPASSSNFALYAEGWFSDGCYSGCGYTPYVGVFDDGDVAKSAQLMFPYDYVYSSGFGALRRCPSPTRTSSRRTTSVRRSMRGRSAPRRTDTRSRKRARRRRRRWTAGRSLRADRQRADRRLPAGVGYRRASDYKGRRRSDDDRRRQPLLPVRRRSVDRHGLQGRCDQADGDDHARHQRRRRPCRRRARTAVRRQPGTTAITAYTFGTTTPTETITQGLQRVGSVAVGPTGTLYAKAGYGLVTEYDKGGTTLSRKVSIPACCNGNIVVDPNDTLYAVGALASNSRELRIYTVPSQSKQWKRHLRSNHAYDLAIGPAW